MATIPIPPRCLTLLPPWTQAIRYAGKRIENRTSGVAASLRDYRGLIGLSQSKSGVSADRKKVDADVVDEAKDIGQTHGWNIQPIDGKITLGMMHIGDWAGHMCLVAELVDVRSPSQAFGLPWHVPGQWGLFLGRVWEVQPVPCMGGQGAWRPQWCVACKKIVADSHGLTCRTCHSTLVAGPEIPQLEIVTEVK